MVQVCVRQTDRQNCDSNSGVIRCALNGSRSRLLIVDDPSSAKIFSLLHVRQHSNAWIFLRKYDELGWLGGVTVRASDLRSSGRGFDSRSCRYRATYVYSAFHPSRVGKSSPGLVGWGYGGARSLVSGVILYGKWRFVAVMGFPLRAIRDFNCWHANVRVQPVHDIILYIMQLCKKQQ